MRTVLMIALGVFLGIVFFCGSCYGYLYLNRHVEEPPVSGQPSP